MDMQNLGKVSPWQIREFPEELRKDIAEQAKAEGVTVSEFVTAHLAALRAAGWHRDTLKPSANGQTGPDMGALRQAVELACLAAEHADRMPRGMFGTVNALLRAELRRLRPGRPLALSGPEPLP